MSIWCQWKQYVKIFAICSSAIKNSFWAPKLLWTFALQHYGLHSRKQDLYQLPVSLLFSSFSTSQPAVASTKNFDQIASLLAQRQIQKINVFSEESKPEFEVGNIFRTSQKNLEEESSNALILWPQKKYDSNAVILSNSFNCSKSS